MSDTMKIENLKISDKKKTFSKLFSKELVLLYLTFCVFFMLNEIIGLGGDLFFTENEEFILLSALKMFGTISLIFLPMSIAIILFIGRDFIKPISMDYFFSWFSTKETEYIWGLIGTIPSLVSFGFTLLIPFLIIMNWKIPIFIAIGIAVVVTIIAYKWLPSTKN